MNCFAVFNKPGRGAYTYQLNGRSLEYATEVARDLSSKDPGLWGEFRYVRATARADFVLGEYYELKPTPAGFSYRRESEDVFAPFDYVNLGGPHRQTLQFVLTWREPRTQGRVELCAMFDAARSFKFIDLCKAYLAKFVIRNDDTPALQFYNRLTHAQVCEIPLSTLQ